MTAAVLKAVFTKGLFYLLLPIVVAVSVRESGLRYGVQSLQGLGGLRVQDRGFRPFRTPYSW